MLEYIRQNGKIGEVMKMAEQKIMIVDDDNNICELLRLYFEKEGYQTLIANNGVEAIETAKKELEGFL